MYRRRMSIETSIHNAANAADRIIETHGPNPPGMAECSDLVLLAVAVKELAVAVDGIVAMLNEAGIPKP